MRRVILEMMSAVRREGLLEIERSHMKAAIAAKIYN